MVMLSMLAALAVAQAAPAVPPTPAPVTTPAPAVRTLFVLSYQQGPKWIAGQPMQGQKLGDHFRYMQALERDGILVGGGPFVGENAGMALVRAKDLAAAQAILVADPAITGGVFTATARAWQIRVGPMRAN